MNLRLIALTVGAYLALLPLSLSYSQNELHKPHLDPEIWVDSFSQLSAFEQVNQQVFQENPAFKFGTTDHTYWFRYRLQNTSQEPQEWWLKVGVFDSLSLLQVNNNTIRRTDRGLLHAYTPEEKQAFQSLQADKYGFRVTLAAGSSSVFYLRVKNIVCFENSAAQISWKKLEVHQQQMAKAAIGFTVFNAAFFGIFLFFICFSFVQYFQNKDSAYYIFYIAFLLLFSPSSLFAQQSGDSLDLKNLSIKHIGVEHGLSQGSVYSIHKDSRGYFWFSSNEGLNRYDGFKIKTFQQSSLDTNSLAGNYTNGIVEDAYGNLWIGSEVCLNRYVRQQDQFDFVFAQDLNERKTNSTNYPFYADSTEVWYSNSKEGILIYNFHNKKKRIISDSFFYNRTNYVINSTFRTRDGHIWIRQETGIVRIDPISKKVAYFFSNHWENVLGLPRNISCFYQNKDGNIWMGSDNQLLKMSSDAKSFEIISLPEGLNATISELREDKNGYLWLGTEQDGLLVFKEGKGIVRQFTTSGNEALQLTNNSPSSIYIDDQGIVWTNVDPEGINVIKNDFKAFRAYREDLFFEDEFASCGTRSFAERPDGKIWVVTQKDGTCLFNPKTEQIEIVLQPDDPDMQDINQGCVFIDSRERVWIGTYNGFLYFENEGQEMKRIVNRSSPNSYSYSNFIWNVLEAPDGNLIFGSEGGVYFMEPDELEPQPLFNINKTTTQLHIDRQGRLLLSEYHNGFHVINYEAWANGVNSQKWSHHFLAEYNVKCFYQNQAGSDYWIGTNNGLLHIYPDDDWEKIDSLKRYTLEDGLPSIYIYGILPDDKNRLWISTNKGLASLDLETDAFKNYVIEDGVQGYEFNTNSYMKASTGEMYFGGTNGFNRFDPNQININPNPPLSIQFTDLLINGKPNREHGYIGELSEIALSYHQNTFTIHYAALDYLSNGQNQYKVFLEGYDADSLEVGTQRFIRYTGVPEGNYVFHVDACNRDGIWTGQPHKLSIQIRPPWFRSWWAYLSYFLGAAFILYTIFDYQNRRRKLKFQLALEHKEAERLKEIDNFKNRIYTNITHEFRTPLTVIQGMADELDQNPNKEPRTKINLIKKNSKNLLDLVNQMLDLSKLQAGKITSDLQKDDIIIFVKYLVETHESFAKLQNVGLQFYSDEKELLMDFDAKKVEQVITNLISNAVKFTPEYGKVLVVAKKVTEKNQAHLQILVKDNGIGISKEQLPLIFDRFHQANPTHENQGSGIGLALVKELMGIMNASISVESELEKGTTFFLEFPIQNKAALVSQTEDYDFKTLREQEYLKTAERNFNNNEFPILLIIEDNADVTYYLQTCLQDQYQILTSRNGKKGIEKAFETLPDIIISDVMMPVMDGFEVCATLKNDERTSHIPIILLTAKATSEDKLLGLTHGADAYLIKPFEKAELIVRLNNLLEIRETLQKKYSSTLISSQSKADGLENKADTYIEKVEKIILGHLEEDDFSIHELARELHLSRSQVHRKIKALTGMSAAIYIRHIRLQKAKELLASSELSIAEIAYQVGFKTPVYFSQVFKETFGESPNATRK